MDEEIVIINTNTRNERIKNFFINNRKSLISVFVVLILILCGYFLYEELQTRKKAKLADQYNLAVIKYESGQTDVLEELKTIINEKDSTYSPLAFYFLIDNQLITSNEEINQYFDVIINATSVGLKRDQTLNLDFSKIEKGKFFYDVIYNPKETNFLKKAKGMGNKTENGKKMFIYQAAASFKIWHNIYPNIDEGVLKILD